MTYLYLVIKFWRECIIALLAIFLIILLAVQNHTAGKLKDAESKCKAKIAAIEQAQQKALIDQQNKANEVSADYEAEKAEQQVKSQVIYKTVEKIVDRPIYRNVCLDSDGLSAINSAIKANNTEQFNSTLP